MEDAINAHQRPKLEVYEDMLFIVLKTARYVDPTEVIELGELLVFLGDDFIITVRHGEASSLAPVREELENDPKHLRHGPGAVLHAILDRVVDDYQPAIEGLETDIDEVEEELFSAGRTQSGASASTACSARCWASARPPRRWWIRSTRLAEGKYGQIHPEIRDYFRDVNDHLMRARDQLDAMRDLLSGSLQANLAQVAVRQNEDVRRISAWVAIIAVPTAIAGIYGMNFDAHARAEVGARLSRRAAPDADHLHVPLLPLQALGLAVGCPAMPDDDCIFCKIVAGELPAEVVQEDEHTIAFMDLNPWTRGHALVIPRNHSRNLYEAPEEDLAHTIAASKRLALRMRDALDCDGINLLNSCEPAAWQTVFHLHVHVIPRYDDDPLRLPGQPLQPEEGELAEVAAAAPRWLSALGWSETGTSASS